MRSLGTVFWIVHPVLRIPMRGYELSGMIVTNAGNMVTNPHEGLWVRWIHVSCNWLTSYESPWGVMRRARTNFIWYFPMVTNPHEGLWATYVVLFNSCWAGYESPWGVMSLALQLATHYCQVTNPHEGLWVRIQSLQLTYFYELRIPMRGYESTKTKQKRIPEQVTNPHEGLWAIVASTV